MSMTTISAIKITSPVTLELTEHNRSSLPLSPELISAERRTANGTMRKYVIAKKNSFQVSWNMLPSRTDLTVDGKSGAEAIKDFYDLYCGQPVTLELKYHQNRSGGSLVYASDDSSTSMSTQTLNVFITSFSYEIVKRLQDSGTTGFDYVNISMGFTEI